MLLSVAYVHVADVLLLRIALPDRKEALQRVRRALYDDGLLLVLALLRLVDLEDGVYGLRKLLHDLLQVLVVSTSPVELRELDLILGRRVGADLVARADGALFSGA